ncbi:MAG: hypothetical protein H7A51_04570 [Akkermansiaceae bacterium]|nr:hypothetical protein [Akkermansiaceae bacterium]
MKTLRSVCAATLALMTPILSQSIEDKIGAPNDDSIRAKVGNQPIDISHSIYTGSYGKTEGVYVLQWFHGTKVRGAFFDSYHTGEIRLYGDNSKPGRIIMEAWKQNQHNGTGLITKGDGTGQLSWTGTIHFTELVDYPVRMTKFVPNGPETLTSSSTYFGKLGNASIKVTLNWYTNGRVRGLYTNLNNNKSYQLTGYNYADGRLYLDEWDTSLGDVEGGAVSARVCLRKVTVNGRIQWQGRMFNMDQRNFAMSFVRTGSADTGNDSNGLEQKLR